MATRTFGIFHQKDNGDGTISFVSGSTATLRVIRLADGYAYDSVSGAFVASGATDVPMAEDAHSSGFYSASLATTSWQDGAYLAQATVVKTGESPWSATPDLFSVAGGASAGSVPSAPSAGLCRVYLYLAEIPATVPTNSVAYVRQERTSGLIYSAPTGVYSAITGVLYWDLAKGSVVSFRIQSRGIARTARIPDTDTALFSALQEVM